MLRLEEHRQQAVDLQQTGASQLHAAVGSVQESIRFEASIARVKLL